MINYGFTKELNVSFSQAVEKATAELKKEGFGVLTKIDLKEKFKEKLGVDVSNYVIVNRIRKVDGRIRAAVGD